MNKYVVTFVVHHDSKNKENVSITVEAGSKKLASLRAMMELRNNRPDCNDLFKTIKSIEEAA